jgi:N-methylhydantoinase A
MAPARVDRVATVASKLDQLDWKELEATFKRLENDALQVIADTGLPPEAARVTRFADMRYIGQAFELVVELPAGPYTAKSRDAILEAFERAYLQTFTRIPPGVSAEFVNIRISQRAEIPGGELALKAREDGGEGGGGGSGKSKKGSRKAYFPEEKSYVDTPVYDRYLLRRGEQLAGPAIVEEKESTLIIGSGASFTIDPVGNLIVDLPQ